MQPRLAITVAALVLIPAGFLFAAETTKTPEPKAPPVTKCEPKMVTYLGVATNPAGAALEHHLGLPCGIGLLVQQVAPDSPAAKAGIVSYDVLQKLDDQLLTGSHQLRVLVWMHKSGDVVKLSLFRNGKPETVTVPLGSTELKCEERACHHEHGYGACPWHFRGGPMFGMRGFCPWLDRHIWDSGRHGPMCEKGTPPASGTDKAPDVKAAPPTQTTH